MDGLFIARNHGVQVGMAKMSPPRLAHCTPQTGGLTRGMTLRARHAADADSVDETRDSMSPIRPRDIACNTLPCSFTRKCLLPLCRERHRRHLQRDRPVLLDRRADADQSRQPSAVPRRAEPFHLPVLGVWVGRG